MTRQIAGLVGDHARCGRRGAQRHLEAQLQRHNLAEPRKGEELAQLDARPDVAFEGQRILGASEDGVGVGDLQHLGRELGCQVHARLDLDCLELQLVEIGIAGLDRQEGEQADSWLEAQLLDRRRGEHGLHVGYRSDIACQAAVCIDRAFERGSESGLQLCRAADRGRCERYLAADFEANAELDIAAKEQARPARYPKVAPHHRQLAADLGLESRSDLQYRCEIEDRAGSDGDPGAARIGCAQYCAVERDLKRRRCRQGKR